MRVLLDNCIPRKFARLLEGTDVTTAVEMGWAKLKDAALLDAMVGDFDVLVTVDKNLRYQQRLHDRAFAVVVLRAKSNRLTHLEPLVPQLLACMAALKPGEVKEIAS
jgi:predicted nuclease of predicted toxin-antitoxin system